MRVGIAMSLAALAFQACAERIIPQPWPPPLPPPSVNVRTNERPLVIKGYFVDATVAGAFATVRTQMRFYNPNDRAIEGALDFPLPEGSAVCGCALDVDGDMRDGTDPGLVELVKGNSWKTRVYPIPANGVRTVRLEYVAPLAFSQSGDAALVLPMPREYIAERAISITVAKLGVLAAPKLGGLGDRRFAEADACWRNIVADSDVVPDDDVVVAMQSLPEQFSTVETDGGDTWFAVSAMRSVAGDPAPPVGNKSFRIVWDASGSRRPEDVARARAVVAELPERAYYSLLVFRDEPEEEQFFSVQSNLLASIDAVRYDGGKDFSALGARLRALVNSASIDNMLFTDGMDTHSKSKLGGGVFAGCTIAAFLSGYPRDAASLRRMCGGRVVDLSTTNPVAALDELISPPRRVAALVGSGLADVMGIGQTVSGCVTVLGRLESDEAELRIDFGPGRMSEPFVIKKSDAKCGRVLARAWAAAEKADSVEADVRIDKARDKVSVGEVEF